VKSIVCCGSPRVLNEQAHKYCMQERRCAALLSTHDKAGPHRSPADNINR